MKLREDGTNLVGLRIDPELADWCLDYARKRGMSRNSWLANLIWNERERIEQAEKQQETA